MSEQREGETDRGSAPPTNKIDRVIEKRDLGRLGAELERRWLGEGREQQSLRDLADYFNRRVLEQAMERADVSTLQGEVENMYGLLTDDEVTEGARTQAKNSLDREGVDVDELLGDFVSHYAVHTYLREHRGVEYPSDEDENQAEKSLQTVQRLKSRLAAVTKRNVENLRSTDRLEVGDVNVIADVQVVCEDCGRQYGATELIENGGCACRTAE